MYEFTVLLLLLLIFFFFFFFLIVMFILAFCHVDSDVCIYRTCAFLNCYCQVDFNNNNDVQRRELVNLHGIIYIRVIIIIIKFGSSFVRSSHLSNGYYRTSGTT